MDRDANGDFLDFTGDLAKVDHDDFVITIAIAGQIIASMYNGTIAAVEVIIEYEIFVAQQFPVLTQQESGGIQVEI